MKEGKFEKYKLIKQCLSQVDRISRQQHMLAVYVALD